MFAAPAALGAVLVVEVPVAVVGDGGAGCGGCAVPLLEGATVLPGAGDGDGDGGAVLVLLLIGTAACCC